MRSGFKSLFTLLLLVFTLTLNGVAQDRTSVRFMPHWLHQAQFAGYYVALEKGYYLNHGLDVEILDGGPAFPAGKVFENNLADIGSMFLSGAIELTDAGLPLLNIGQLSKKSALIFIARKSDSISTVEDFNGKKIGIWRSDFRELPLAFLKKYNISADIVPITSTINLFLDGGIDIMCVMWYNEYNQVYLAGTDYDDLNAFFFYDHDLNFPEDGIYCTRDYYQKHPQVCDDFAEATLEGWRYAFAHKAEAVNLVLDWMKRHNIPANRAHQRWMLDVMEKVFLSEDGSLNSRLNREDYRHTAKVLRESGSIGHIEPWDQFYKNN